MSLWRGVLLWTMPSQAKISLQSIYYILYAQCGWWSFLSQILQLTWKSVGGPNPSRGDNFFRRPLAPKILLVPPQVSYMVGISGKVARGYTCQNLCNWILEGTRADLAPPLYCQFAKMHYSELTIQGRANWQYRGGARSALVPSRIQLHKFWQAYPRATLPLIPTMYDTWGSTSRILGARGLWKKISPLEGFGPPTDFQVSWRIWLGLELLGQLKTD